ncbi:conserved oligomeric Golgi complex subunit 8-like [Ctenocephalides felis]|uniref:conserved oligomeric Golgi complex subunit 8-like n=1 Tax=Ctenocephalides felis TaxID=7515 RepID=UPI000E6E2E39|nr:conserved oligomeric Golgi complex subunit 8-like [Ctenocephalides felis]
METGKVFKLLFPHGCPDSLQNNAQFTAYLNKLGSCTVDQLQREEPRLSEEKKLLIQQTQELAISNYKTFIQTAECSREIYNEFKCTKENLDSLLSKIPEFATKCDNFMTTSSDINSDRYLNQITLNHSSELLEILELPTLMETCIREGQFEEALELAAYIKRLGMKHGHILIVKSIVSDMEKLWQHMLQKLLSSLGTDLTLPKCLQIVGYLRRMEAFTEPELRIRFLQAREEWLTNLLSDIPKDDASHHLSKTIELSRIHLFNIVTQYKAIFNDDDQYSFPNNNQVNINKSYIFYGWLHKKITQIIYIMEKDLEKATSSLDSLIGQCMYFGLSFSRVGADFRSLMAPIILKTIYKKFYISLSQITKKLKDDLENFTLINKHYSNSRTKGQEGLTPPQSLLDFYPLAEYCNGLLTIFNEFRLCTPLSLVDKVTTDIQNSLIVVSESILSYYKREHKILTSSEKDNFTNFCVCYAYDLLPYIQKCLHTVFPCNTVATFLGISISNVENEGIGYLDTKSILETIDNLLPKKYDVQTDITNNKTDDV